MIFDKPQHYPSPLPKYLSYLMRKLKCISERYARFVKREKILKEGAKFKKKYRYVIKNIEKVALLSHQKQ